MTVTLNSYFSVHRQSFLIMQSCPLIYVLTTAGVPSLQDVMPDDSRWSRYNNNKKCTRHVMCLNHPQTTTVPPSMEKLSSMKSAPGAEKG